MSEAVSCCDHRHLEAVLKGSLQHWENHAVIIKARPGLYRVANVTEKTMHAMLKSPELQERHDMG